MEMKCSRTTAAFLLMGIHLSGCATGRPDLDKPVPDRACKFVAVYAANPSPSKPGEIQEDKHWVNIRVNVSESGLDFGYLNDRGNFIKLFSGSGGNIEIQGGLYYPYAVRIRSPELSVYSIADCGTCRPAGDSIQTGRAIRPPVSEGYTSAVIIQYRLPGRSNITALLAATPPNGFVFE
jgi:hypothetical protein